MTSETNNNVYQPSFIGNLLYVHTIDKLIKWEKYKRRIANLDSSCRRRVEVSS